MSKMCDVWILKTILSMYSIKNIYIFGSGQGLLCKSTASKAHLVKRAGAKFPVNIDVQTLTLQAVSTHWGR